MACDCAMTCDCANSQMCAVARSRFGSIASWVETYYFWQRSKHLYYGQTNARSVFVGLCVIPAGVSGRSNPVMGVRSV